MALLYPWATKEYLLWQMSIGQILLYHNIGMELKYGNGKSETPGLADLEADELRKIRDEVLGSVEPPDRRDEMRAKYGAIDG